MKDLISTYIEHTRVVSPGLCGRDNEHRGERVNLHDHIIQRHETP